MRNLRNALVLMVTYGLIIAIGWWLLAKIFGFIGFVGSLVVGSLLVLWIAKQFHDARGNQG